MIGFRSFFGSYGDLFIRVARKIPFVNLFLEVPLSFFLSLDSFFVNRIFFALALNRLDLFFSGRHNCRHPCDDRFIFFADYFRFLFAIMFAHLNCHSNYSLLEGADRVDDLVRAADRMKCPALALTDTNALYGAVEFYRQSQSAGIHPVFGAEIVSGLERAVLLAKDMQGFGEVCRVVSDRQLQKNFSLIDRLKQCTDHVIILTPFPKIIHEVAKERGGKNIYGELHRFPSTSWKQSFDMLRYAESNGIPLAATNRVFFIHEKDWQVHKLLSAIRTITTVDALPEKSCMPKDAWMKSPKNMARLFRDIPKAILNTGKIAEQCNVALPIGEVLFPPYDLPSGEAPSSYLSRLADQGMKKLYPELSTIVTDRLKYELKIINDLGFASYFLIVWDIVREAGKRNIPTVGRGSAANSLVCRVLGITEVDPIKYDLYFERFLNPERKDYPDIDIDFPWNRRDEMIEYIFEKYGQQNVALISAHIHMRGRLVLREVGKALGIPIPEIDHFVKRLPHHGDLSNLEEVRATVPECRNLPIEDEPYKTMIALGKRISGFPRHVSIHCGGIVICPFPITDRIPLQKTQKGFVVTQYDMYPVEDMGLLKIDLLSQMGLAVLMETVDDVETHYGTRIDFSAIDPIQDEKTVKLVREGKTIGCFYIESPGMRNLLKKLNVESFEMLTAASSIIRPGVAESGMMKAFIDRHNGKEKVIYLHPKLEKILHETFGVMIYQEDVIKVANAIAGMSLGEADSLRKCMSKKRDWEDMNNYRERFLKGALRNGVALDTAQEIWRQIESFAGYAFCKAHSASFAIVSYQTAYLKAHYPAEFMASVLSNHGGFYDSCGYVEEARRMGLAILPPHVNHSESRFTAVSVNGSEKRNAIRVGLSQVKGLSHNAIESILRNRKNKPYDSLRDFIYRVGIDTSEVETLTRCGALDGFGASRPNMLWDAMSLFESKHRHLEAKQKCLVDFEEEAPLLEFAEYGRQEKVMAELECLDIAVSNHLLSLYDIQHEGLASANAIPSRPGKLITLAGWLVNSKRTRTSRNEFMKFLMLEDATETFEVTLFPKIYRRFGPLLFDRGPYLVRGRVEQEGQCFTVTALWLGRAVKY